MSVFTFLMSGQAEGFDLPMWLILSALSDSPALSSLELERKCELSRHEARKALENLYHLKLIQWSELERWWSLSDSGRTLMEKFRSSLALERVHLSINH